VLVLEPRVHADFHELPADLQAELGPLMVRIERAVAAVEGVGRVHIGRWGEGSEHFHLWFMGRPARMPQFASSFAAIWDDVLPPTPEDVWHANLELVRDALNSRT
jgi:diadenosine tetraphosphate (Ap4A) HIT family hydrolase